MIPEDPQLRMLEVGIAGRRGASESPLPEKEPAGAPDELRDEIHRTREQLGDTVESLARAYIRERFNERIKRTFARGDTAPQNDRTPDNRPVSELTKLASELAARLVRAEIRLAHLD